jgi:hypothetical protein
LNQHLAANGQQFANDSRRAPVLAPLYGGELLESILHRKSYHERRAGRQLVLAFVARTALADYFRMPRRPTMRESNLIVDRNLEAFARIVAANYSRGQVGVYSSCGQTFPRVDITLEDIERSGEQFTADVLKLEAAFQWAPA